MGVNHLWSFISNNDGTVSITDYIGSGINIEIPSFINNYRVTEIDDFAFSPFSSHISNEQKRIRKKIKHITIPNGIINIGKSVFYGCENLLSINIPESVSYIGPKTFLLNYKLCNIDVDKNNQKYASINGILYNKSKDKILFIPDGIEGTISLPDSMSVIRAYDFYGLSNLENIIISDSVTEIRKYAFTGCKKLSCIIIPESVTKIEKKVFKDCSNLCKVVFKNKNIDIQENWFDYPFIDKIADSVYPCQLSHKLKVDAFPYIINLLLHNSGNLDKGWKDAWLKYFSRIRKSIYEEITENYNLLTLMTKEKMLDLNDIKSLIVICTEKKMTEKSAILLNYENDNFKAEEVTRFTEKIIFS